MEKDKEVMTEVRAKVTMLRKLKRENTEMTNGFMIFPDFPQEHSFRQMCLNKNFRHTKVSHLQKPDFTS